jgi:mono/diheme cytochrome c family protein
VRTYLALLASLVLACGSDSSSDPGPDGGATDGAALFEANCQSCHGDGSGTNLGPTILNPVAGYATFVVRAGRNEMGFPNGGMAALTATDLPDAQLAAILTFLGTAAKPTTGPELYGRFCENCHGANGRSGRVAKNIVREANAIARIVRTGHGGSSYGSRGSYMPSWTTAELTDAEVTAIRTYVTGL